MKKVALLLAAAMLALAGCASAGDTAAASEAALAESTAESAAAEDSTEAALPGEPYPLSAYSACAVSGSSVYAAVTHFSSSEDSLGSFDHSTVYKTDLTTGQTYEMYRTDSQLASAPLIIDDTLYFICYDGGMLALPTTGGEARVLPFSYDDWMPVFYAGHYLYCRSVSAAPFCRTGGMRFNLENGETAPWNIPVETMYIPDVVGDALLLCRVVSDYPVPYPDDDEMSQALLQNTTLEYTLADPATGAVRQTCSPMTYRSRGALRSTPTLVSAAVTSISAQTSATTSTLWFPSPCCASARTAPGPTLALPKRRITWITVRFCRAMRCAGS